MSGPLDLEVGQRATRQMSVTHDHELQYAGVTGDTIAATAEVVSVHASKPVCQLRIVVDR